MGEFEYGTYRPYGLYGIISKNIDKSSYLISINSRQNWEMYGSWAKSAEFEKWCGSNAGSARNSCIISYPNHFCVVQNVIFIRQCESELECKPDLEYTYKNEVVSAYAYENEFNYCKSEWGYEYEYK